MFKGTSQTRPNAYSFPDWYDDSLTPTQKAARYITRLLMQRSEAARKTPPHISEDGQARILALYPCHHGAVYLDLDAYVGLFPGVEISPEMEQQGGVRITAKGVGPWPCFYARCGGRGPY